MIFEDPSQKRWRMVRLAFIFFAVVCIGLFGLWIASIAIDPPLPSVKERQQNHAKALQTQQKIERIEAVSADTTTPGSGAAGLKKAAERARRVVLPQGAAVSFKKLFPGKFISTAFLQQKEVASVDSFKQHADHIDVVFPNWYFVTQSTCNISEREDPDVTKVLSASHALIMPRITNGDNGVWYSDEFHKILRTPSERDCLSQLMVDMAVKSNVAGINVDFEALKPQDKDLYLDFLSDIAGKLHAKNKLLSVDVPPRNEAFDAEYIGKIADAVVLMSYDEHFAGGEPGPIASQTWFVDTLEELQAQVPADKLIVAVGTYGYDWTIDSKNPAQDLKFSEVMSLADDVYAQPEMEQTSRNMFFAYTDEKNLEHHVWFLNGITAWNQERVVYNNGLLGMSFWKLGTEDPSLWYFVNDQQVKGSAFATVPGLTTIEYKSEGELFRLEDDAIAGSLDLTFDSDGSIDYAQYTQLPSGYVFERYGADMPAKHLVLTFDDGPDEVWTPKVMDVLQKYHVPGTFFVVGDQAQRFPDLLARMAKNGFLVGNHTYLHPNIAEISDQRMKFEMNRTERVIESEYGKKTILFRPPFDTDTAPSTPEQVQSIARISKYNYVIAGANIDPDDWAKPGSDVIAQRILDKALNPANHVIVLHDAGGDRAQTVAALDKVIPELQARGYVFDSLDKVSGVPTNVLMPSLGGGEFILVLITSFISWLQRWVWLTIVWLFFLTTGISIVRILFLGVLVLRSWKTQHRYRSAPTNNIFVSVIVPVFNEEQTVETTLKTLLKSDHKEFEIVVVDDGSTDKTADMVRMWMKKDDRIRLISKKNGGKASALNLGMQESKAEYVVTIDGDTIILPHTITALLQPFSDSTVDAVCGNVEVGNTHNILTSFQALEYITTQNFDRRAFDELNCISVVPGATGAWRRKKIIALGGYYEDTLTEDADLTLRLLQAGGKIVYAPEARSRTEAPATVSDLAKQRFRWSFGTFQCLYKHRGSFFQGPLGWVALPNMFLFQVIFPILSPIGDIVFILSIFRGDVQAIFMGYMLFLLMDVSGSLLAFVIEDRPKKLMWFILIQRFFYRQFMYVITYRSLVAILRGKKHGWNKIDRTGAMNQS